MQKYKKWKQVLSVSTAVSLCIAGAGSLMGCGSTDRGKDKADSVDCGFAGYERGKPENACKKQ